MTKWRSVGEAPRDGTPVILWIEDDQPRPAFPITVGVWIPDANVRASYWRVFSAEYGTTSYFDEHIRGWQPLPLADA